MENNEQKDLQEDHIQNVINRAKAAPTYRQTRNYYLQAIAESNFLILLELRKIKSKGENANL